MPVNTQVLFDVPQHEVASLIRSRLSTCVSASIVTGFLTPSGVGILAAPIRTRPDILKHFIVGAATYPGFEALDQLVTWGVPLNRLRVHLGHTRQSGGKKHPFVRHHPMLHSKVYYMEFAENQACAFVGSHNVTSFALKGLNGEAAILIEGPGASSEFGRIRDHIQSAFGQALPYSPGMKEAFAWWTKEFLEGLQSEIAIPTDWTTTRTILIFATATSGERPCTGQHVYFELPDGVAIDSLKTEAHLFLFNAMPTNPWQALQEIPNAQAHYTCKVIGAENLQGNLEIRTHWQIEALPSPTLRAVPTGIFRPSTPSGMQQVRAEVTAPSVTRYEYLFERERVAWWPLLSNSDTLSPDVLTEEGFPIADTPWQKESDQPWQLVTGLKQGDGPTVEKDAAALELVKPESGSFVLVSLRRRQIKRAQSRKKS